MVSCIALHCIALHCIALHSTWLVQSTFTLRSYDGKISRCSNNDCVVLCHAMLRGMLTHLELFNLEAHGAL